MELSKLQVIALSILTTIITDKYLINHPTPTLIAPPTPTATPIPTITATTTTGTTPIPTPIPTNNQNDIILRELANLRKDIGQISASSPVPAVSGQPPIGGMVKISSPQWKRIDVYEKAATNSKVISSIVYDNIYFYRQKQNGWHQLDLDAGNIGWVQSQFLKEYP